MSGDNISDNNQFKFMILSSCVNQDDSMLEPIDGITLDSVHAVSLDYLHECMSDFESKDSGIRLSPESPHVLRTDSNSEKFSDQNLANLNSCSMKEVPCGTRVEKNDISSKHDLPRSEYCVRLVADPMSLGITEKERNNVEQKDEQSTTYGVGNSIVAVVHGKNSNSVSYSGLRLNRPGMMSGDENGSSTPVLKSFDKPLSSDYSTDRDSEKSSDGEELISERRGPADGKLFDGVNKSEILPVGCDQCPMTFKYKRHLDRHLEGHDKNNCPHCDAKFARKKHLHVHLFRLHGERITKYPHTCDLCSRSFPKRLLLNRHKAAHHYEKAKVCAECGDILENESDVKEHQEKHVKEKRFHCDKCPQAFSMEQKYLIHVKNHDAYKCPRCDAMFASKKRANEHYRTIHSDKQAKEPQTHLSGMYYCTDCRHNFMTKDSYVRHLETAAHLSKMHDEVPLRALFTCSTCSKQLTTRKALDQHVRRVHRDGKKFSCDTEGCEFQCTNKSDLERHRQLHIEERNIVCEHCGKTFTSIGILKDHVLYVHNMERQFVCEECGKAFKRNSLLNRHKMSHQQIRPFSCVQCGAAFKRSHHLSRHMESCHRITMEKKKKVVKLMKTDDGRLVPIPEEPKKPKVKKVKTEKEENQSHSFHESTDDVMNCLVVSKAMNDLSSELSRIAPMSTMTSSESTEVSIGLSNGIPEVDSVPQILSLVDVNSGQVVTVELSNPDTLPLTDLVDQFEANCNEILGLSGYSDLGFQTGILNTEQNYYDHVNYAELPLENVGEPSLLLDTNSSKMDTLPAIENYLTQPFSPFLNL